MSVAVEKAISCLTNKPFPNFQVNEDDENEDEDLITLRGGGIFTQYRFPQSTDCPSKCCNREFDNRSDAIVHYKIWHALNFMFCFECEKPVCTNNLNNYKEHYEQMHPQSEILSAKIIEPIDPDSKTDEVSYITSDLIFRHKIMTHHLFYRVKVTVKTTTTMKKMI